MTTGSVFIVCAPSGAGKTSLVNALLEREPDIELSISYTTRHARTGESDGRHYSALWPLMIGVWKRKPV